ncbi:signal peptide peptidase SppA [Pseudoalteromonas sp. T1lg88]|uniref:signal peptide peptidase SppA n=1 Tax=Pseudoalteromonas sp. T1lg88 TaxID=2077104 RepID=UPI000CF6CF2A|nr:signal peptide peptidase SppA [Pseudoalteromonas sp. T1lg88]
MIKKVVKATWDGINFSRRLVVNLIFIALVIIVIASITSDDGEIKVPQGAVLNLNLNGYLVEQKRYVDPLDAALAQSMGAQDEPAEILVDDVVDVINKAANDERIEAMLLNVQNLGGAHINKLAAIAKAIEAFKAQGKPVIATGYYYTQSQYYLAAHADEINLHPYGGVSIEGFGVYPVYFKEALDKLKITQHVFRVGTFKSAVEPLIRNDMSQAAKEANKEWLSHLWQQYKDEIATLRGFEQTNFDESLDTYLAKLEKVDGNGAKYALQNGWVDALKNNQELRQQMIDLVGLDEKGKSFRQIGFNDYLATFKMPIAVDNPLTEKVAVIVAKGTIVDGHRKAGEIGGDSTAALLREARNNDRVKAVVLRIDSGGGSMFASELIRREVIALKEAGKPVVASMGSVAASGGYWIASAANEIWAAPSTITGSIGVFGTIMTFEKSAAKLGVYSDGVGTTELKGSSVLLGLDDKLAQAIQMSVENAYSRFLEVVSESRGLSLEEVDKIAQGRVWIATQAQQLGLVDQLGDKQAAISAAAKLASLKHYDVQLIEQPLSPQDIFIQNLFGNAAVQSLVAKQAPQSASVGAAMQFDNFVEQIEQQVNSLKAFNDPEGIYARCLVCTVTN